MDFNDWLKLLGENWESCDNISECRELLAETPFGDLLEWSGGALTLARVHLMTAEENAALDALPNVITIYRGAYENNAEGLSWTLDKGIAAKFPSMHRYQQDGEPLLITATVDKDRIVALKLDRNEQEVITKAAREISRQAL